MKKLFTILAVAMCSTLAMAQTNQYFWAGGQFIMGNPINQIDSITFGQLEQTDSVTLYLPRTVKVIHDTVIQTKYDTIIQNNYVRMCDNAPEGVELVDLGLPSGIKWANMNIGATKPEEYGDYFAWGETEIKMYYYLNTYKFYDENNYAFTKYCINSFRGEVDNKTILDSIDDAASIFWGGKWRIPIAQECQELINYCNWSWIQIDSIHGYKVSSKVNANYIFLPATGYFGDYGKLGEGVQGNYWSSMLDEDDSYYAQDFSFDRDTVYMGYIGGRDARRYDGQTIRPVCK